MKKGYLNIQTIITMILLICLISISILIGVNIKNSGSDIRDFCKDHYKNETFISNFIGDDPAILKECCMLEKKSLGIIPYWSEFNEDYQECLMLNGTDEEKYFIQNCHWMGPDYFIMAGTMLFLYFIPLSIISIEVAVYYEKIKKDKRRNKKC